jgi:hypothetical protein
MEEAGKHPIESTPVGEAPDGVPAVDSELTAAGQGAAAADAGQENVTADESLTVESVDHEPRDARGRTPTERMLAREAIIDFYHLPPGERRRRTAALPRVRARLGRMAWRQNTTDADTAK